ncbi:hypothetical protein MRX96_014622 [Rhipicephalus microplus]
MVDRNHVNRRKILHTISSSRFPPRRRLHMAVSTIAAESCPPIVPRVAHDGDTRYFDRCPESKVVPSEHGLTPKELALFDDF